jgi:hypothetical protein
MVATPKGKTSPLELELVTLGDDVRGLFVAVTGALGSNGEPLCYGISAARELGLIVSAGDLVYRSHFGTCPDRDRFRRRR